jgi:hypothetical protein
MNVMKAIRERGKEGTDEGKRERERKSKCNTGSRYSVL